MTTFEYVYTDGTTERVEASYYKKVYNPNSDTYEYVFRDENDKQVRLVPELWLDPISGSPREV